MGEKEFLVTLSELLDKKIDVIVTQKIPAVLDETLKFSLLPKLNEMLSWKQDSQNRTLNLKPGLLKSKPDLPKSTTNLNSKTKSAGFHL